MLQTITLDIKGKISELTEKIKSDPKLLTEFKSEPVKTLEKLLGIDLPDAQLKALADGIKARLSADKLSGALGGIFKK